MCHAFTKVVDKTFVTFLILIFLQHYANILSINFVTQTCFIVFSNRKQRQNHQSSSPNQCSLCEGLICFMKTKYITGMPILITTSFH